MLNKKWGRVATGAAIITAAVAGTVAGGALISVFKAHMGAQDMSIPADDPLKRGADIVRANQEKPCAREMAKKSAVMLAHKGMKCE
jgi:hypothetical protein